MTHPPPVTVGVGLVPIRANAGLAGAAVVEKDCGLADFRPLHRVLPLARMEAASADVVLDDVRRMLAFDVAHLAINDQIVLPIHLLDAQHHDVRGQRANEAETVRRFDIGME